MNDINRQIMAAHRELDAFTHDGSSGVPSPKVRAADQMHALLVARADALMGCTENSQEEAELAALTDAIEAYEGARWSDGKVANGKG